MIMMWSNCDPDKPYMKFFNLNPGEFFTVDKHSDAVFIKIDNETVTVINSKLTNAVTMNAIRFRIEDDTDVLHVKLTELRYE